LPTDLQHFPTAAPTPHDITSQASASIGPQNRQQPAADRVRDRLRDSFTQYSNGNETITTSFHTPTGSTDFHATVIGVWFVCLVVPVDDAGHPFLNKTARSRE
jgi:hypothetical protein